MLTRQRLRLGGVMCAAIAVMGLAGCDVGSAAGPTTPVPTPTHHPGTTPPVADVDIEGAIAAFNAYMDASNSVDWSDPGSFEGQYSLTTGDQNAYDRKFNDGMFEHGWRSEGSTTAVVLGSRAGAGGAEVLLEVCMDFRGLRILDETGAERRPADSPQLQGMTATLTNSNGEAWLLSDLDSRDGEPECQP